MRQGDNARYVYGNLGDSGKRNVDSFFKDVAQQGLRDMVGEQRFNDFLMRAFRDADEPIRRQIANEGMRGGLNFLDSTNGYLAKQDKVDEAYLNKIKSLYTSMLNEYYI